MSVGSDKDLILESGLLAMNIFWKVNPVRKHHEFRVIFSCLEYGYTRRWGYICWGSRSETKYSLRSTCMAIRRRRVASAPRVLTQACALSAARVPRRSVPTLLHDVTMAGSFPLSGFVVVVILLFGAAFFFFPKWQSAKHNENWKTRRWRVPSPSATRATALLRLQLPGCGLYLLILRRLWGCQLCLIFSVTPTCFLSSPPCAASKTVYKKTNAWRWL